MSYYNTKTYDDLKEPDYVPVRYEGRVGLTPNPISPKFGDLNYAAEGYVLFWIPDADIRGVDASLLEQASWLELSRVIIDKIFLNSPMEILKWLSNSNEFKSRYFDAPALLDVIIDGFAKERAYDFRKWEKL